jgi:hypothetical protein
MYNRLNGQTSMAAVQGPNRYLGTQDRPRHTDRQTGLLIKNDSPIFPFLGAAVQPFRDVASSIVQGTTNDLDGRKSVLPRGVTG